MLHNFVLRYLKIVGGKIKSIETMPDCWVVATDARITETLEQQQLHGTLMPSQDLLDTPCQACRLMSAPGKHLSGLVDVHTAPPLSESIDEDRNSFKREHIQYFDSFMNYDKNIEMCKRQTHLSEELDGGVSVFDKHLRSES